MYHGPVLSLNFPERVHLLQADDLDLMSETTEDSWIGSKNGSRLLREGLESNVGKTKVISNSITLDGMSKRKDDPCGVSSWRVKANSVLCVQCGKWIHGRCAGVKTAYSQCQ